MKAAGFRNIRIVGLRKYVPVTTRAAFWKRMNAGSAPVVELKRHIGAAQWRKKEKLAIAYLKRALPRTPTRLYSEAWLGIGEKI